MKTFKIIGIVALVLIVVLGIVIAIQPPHAHIEQSIIIDAPADEIFPEVSNYKNFVTWSPWSKMDPGVTQTFEGEPGTIGAKMNWDGPKTGEGSQWIVDIEKNKRVRSGMDFGGMEGEYFTEFILTPEGNQTRVTWTYDGQNHGVGGKAMWVIMGSMLTSQFKTGLSDLKELVENKNHP